MIVPVDSSLPFQEVRSNKWSYQEVGSKWTKDVSVLWISSSEDVRCDRSLHKYKGTLNKVMEKKSTQHFYLLTNSVWFRKNVSGWKLEEYMEKTSHNLVLFFLSIDLIEVDELLAWTQGTTLLFTHFGALDGRNGYMWKCEGKKLMKLMKHLSLIFPNKTHYPIMSRRHWIAVTTYLRNIREIRSILQKNSLCLDHVPHFIQCRLTSPPI